MPWAVAGAAIGAAGSYYSSKNNKEAAEIGSQSKLDPRIADIVFGKNNDGILSQYQGLLNTPGSDASKNYSSANADYLNAYGGQDMNAIRNSSLGLMTPDAAPQAGQGFASIPAYAVGNQVDAPAQNNINLTGTFQSMLNGGDTSALMKSLQAGNALTNEQLRQNQASLTDNLQRNVLPGISGGAIAAGQYGGSRQGIAQGNAISDFTKQLNDSSTQIGLAGSANTASQLANNYEQGQGRALAAAQGLSQQQYTTALQNANTKNAAEFMNVGNSYDDSKYNAGLDQQTKMANLNSQLQTNQQNNAGAVSGSGLLGGLLNQANGGLSSATNYAQGVNGLMVPYLSANQSQTQPSYQNTAGNVMGGALMGSQLGGLFGNTGSGSSLSNMKGSTSSSIYAPSSGGGIDWGSMSSLFS